MDNIISKLHDAVYTIGNQYVTASVLGSIAFSGAFGVASAALALEKNDESANKNRIDTRTDEGYLGARKYQERRMHNSSKVFHWAMQRIHFPFNIDADAVIGFAAGGREVPVRDATGQVIGTVVEPSPLSKDDVRKSEATADMLGIPRDEYLKDLQLSRAEEAQQNIDRIKHHKGSLVRMMTVEVEEVEDSELEALLDTRGKHYIVKKAVEKLEKFYKGAHERARFHRIADVRMDNAIVCKSIQTQLPALIKILNELEQCIENESRDPSDYMSGKMH